MIKLNKYWLDFVWGFINENHDVKDITSLNMNEEQNVKVLVESHLRIYYSNLPRLVHFRLKEIWRYSLNFLPEKDLIYSLAGIRPPFETPVQIRRFYKNTWNLLFFNESYEIEDSSQYIIYNKPFDHPWKNREN